MVYISYLVDYRLVLAVRQDEFEVLGAEVADADRLELTLVLESLELLPRGKELALFRNESW